MQELIERLRSFRDNRGWDKFHTPKNLAISVSVEAGELLELFQWRPEDAPLDAETVQKISDEVADVLLYLLLLCDKANIDLAAAANRKMDHNENRFPVSRSYGIAKPQVDGEGP
jgi:NTP pyrophosphatase (non-canonical NTP hydrolase)